MTFGGGTNIEVTYYAYEYDVIMQISEMFKIKGVNYDSEITYAYTWMTNSVGVLKETKVAEFVGNSTIKFCFDNDFNVEVSREMIKNSYHKHINSKEIVAQISNDIENAWLNRIRK